MATGEPSRARRSARIALAGICFVACLVVGGFAGVFAYLHLAFGIDLRNQNVRMLLPPAMKVRTRITNVVDVGLSGDVTAQVPLRQVFRPRLRGRYDATMSLETDVPIDLTVRHQAVIPIDTFAEVEMRADFTFVKQYRNVQVRAKLPMKFDLPIDLTIPVRQTVHVAARGPVAVEIDQTVAVPIDATIAARTPIDELLSAPVTGSFDVEVGIPPAPVPIIVDYAAVRARLRTARPAVAPDPSLPKREALSPENGRSRSR